MPPHIVLSLVRRVHTPSRFCYPEDARLSLISPPTPGTPPKVNLRFPGVDGCSVTVAQAEV